MALTKVNSTLVDGAINTTVGGDVGIGISNPGRQLTVYGSFPCLQLTNATSGSTANDGLLIFQSGLNGYVSNQEAGIIGFETNNTERMRIDSSGRVQVGTTATNPAPSNTYGIVLGTDGSGNAYAGAAQFSTNGTAALQLNRGADDGTTVVFRRTGTLVGAINVTSSSTSYVTSSDYRLKENIVPMTGALAKVALLKPCTYTWKSDNSQGQGFIAHELQEVVPDAVTGQKDAVDAEGNIDPQGIDTSFLVATLTAAIQEQQAIITDLKARIETLEAK